MDGGGGGSVGVHSEQTVRDGGGGGSEQTVRDGGGGGVGGNVGVHSEQTVRDGGGDEGSGGEGKEERVKSRTRITKIMESEGDTDLEVRYHLHFEL
jgi:hypothetical protein